MQNEIYKIFMSKNFEEYKDNLMKKYSMSLEGKVSICLVKYFVLPLQIVFK